MLQRSIPARLALLSVLAVACDSGPSMPPLNVLLVTIDTLRADRVGAYGYAPARTPTLDRLASEGVRFAQASAHVPITLPSHASILTGRSPVSHGVRLNGSFRLSEAERTLAERLGDAGYTTHAVLAAVVLNRRYGLAQGFDGYDDLAVRTTRGESELERRADEVTERALAWLEAHHDQRFFLWVHYFDPHQPYDPPPPFRDDLADPYDGEVAATDAALGRLLEGLVRSGVDRDTVVIVTSDHGEGLGDHDEDTHSYFVYESTLRVPLLWRAPGVLPAGVAIEDPVRTVDIVPTLLDLLDLPAATDADGTSLLPRLDGSAPLAPLEVYGESLAAALTFGYSPLRSLRVGDWKYILAPTPELYDLARDPGEQHDRSGEEPERAAELRARLVARVEAQRPEREPGAALALDPATRQQLQRLGYLGGAADPEAVQRLDAQLEPAGADPKRMTAVFQRLNEGEGRHKAGRLEAAARSFEAALELDPGNEYAVTYLAILHGEQGRVEEALAVFDRLAGPPKLGLALEVRGKLEMRRHDWAAAERTFRTLLASEPHNVWAHYYLGRAYTRTGRDAQAVAAFQTALGLEPSLVEARAALATALLRAGRADEATEQYRVALEAAPERSPYAFGLGLSLEAAGRIGEAVDAYRRVVVQAPGHVRAQERVVLGLLQLGRIPEAAAEARTLLAMRPGSQAAQVALAAAAAEEGDLARAREILERAVAADASLAIGWYQLARVHARAGESGEALAALERAVAQGGGGYRRLARRDPDLGPLAERLR